MDIQSLVIITTIGISTLLQVIAFFKNDKETITKLEKKKQKLINKTLKCQAKIDSKNNITEV